MDDKVTLIGIINGVDVVVDIEREKSISDFVEFVCTNSNNIGRPFDQWIVREAGAKVIPHNLNIGKVYDVFSEKSPSYSPVLRLFFNLDYSKEEKKIIKAAPIREKIVLCAKEIVREIGQVPTFGGSDVDKRLADLYSLVRELKIIEES